MAKKKEDKQIVNNEEFEKLQKELESLKELSLQLENQLRRAVADYQNLEKRVSEGRSELSSWANASLLSKILPTLDHLDQALNGATEADKASGWFKGVELAVKELNQVLAGEGLDQIVADGQFDPNLHEAVDTQVGEDNKILKVVRKGYTVNGKVLRPVAVVVGKKNPVGETESGIHSPLEEK